MSTNTLPTNDNYTTIYTYKAITEKLHKKHLIIILKKEKVIGKHIQEILHKN